MDAIKKIVKGQMAVTENGEMVQILSKCAPGAKGSDFIRVVRANTRLDTMSVRHISKLLPLKDPDIASLQAPLFEPMELIQKDERKGW